MSFLIVILSIISFLLIISLLTFFHELGHYFVAKKSGVKIIEFSVGMGPVLFQRLDQSGTMWSIRAFPIGGYVMPVTESLINYLDQIKQEAKNLDADQQQQILRKIKPLSLNDTFSERQILDNARLFPKLIFTLGGVSVNLLLVWVGLFISYKTVGRLEMTDDAYFIQNAQAAKISSITYIPNATPSAPTSYTNFHEIDAFFDLTFSTDDKLTMRLVDGESNPIPPIPFEYKNNEWLGVSNPGIIFANENVSELANYFQMNTLDAFAQSFIDMWIYVGRGFVFLWYLIDPSQNTTPNDYFMFSNGDFMRRVSMWINVQLTLFAFLSALLLVFNILPIPPLDGFKFANYLFEGITNKRMSVELENRLNRIGWILMIIFTFWVLFFPL